MSRIHSDAIRRRRFGVDPRIAANYLIAKSIKDKSPKTHLQIMKLLFFAHVLRLAAYGRPLSRRPAEAWKFGPVFRDLYHALKGYGRNKISSPIPGYGISTSGCELDAQQRQVLDQTYDDFGKVDGVSLSHMTHWPDNPWSKARQRGDGSLLSDSEIEEYYKEYLTDSK